MSSKSDVQVNDNADENSTTLATGNNGASTPTRFLSAAEILRGGSAKFRVVEVPSLLGDGNPGSVRFRAISTKALLSLQELRKGREQGEDIGSSVIIRTVEVLAECLVDENGDLMFTFDDLILAPIDVVNALGSAVISASITAGESEGEG